MGGFKTVEEIAKTYGLSDSIFQLIKPGLYVEVSSQISDNKPYKININKATERKWFKQALNLIWLRLFVYPKNRKDILKPWPT